jgi:hypothetical protein
LSKTINGAVEIAEVYKINVEVKMERKKTERERNQKGKSV